MDKYLFLIPLLPLLGAAFNLIIGRKLRPRVAHRVACGTVLASFAIAFAMVVFDLYPAFSAWKAGVSPAPNLEQSLYTWIEIDALKIDLALRLDTLSAVLVLIITFVGFLIHVYSIGYMEGDSRYSTYFGFLNLFTGSMLVLVLAANMPVMFIGWEGVGMCSYLLIGFWFTDEAKATAGRKAFVVNRIGDFAFLLGMFLLFWIGMKAGVKADDSLLTFANTTTPTAAGMMQEGYLGGERLATIAGILLFIGACGKSAQIPLYVWLPDAMAGPTPVSALIHAATMVTAGVYMVARLSFLYASSTTAMAVVAGVGAATALLAAIMAFAQTDLKKVLAYSTVSQLGFMFVAVGIGAHVAGIFHLMTHAFFKAGLFLGAGSVMHAMSGSGDICKMGGLRHKLPITHATFGIFCLAIAGFPFFSGFFSKDEILAGAFFADAVGWAPFYGKVLWGVLTLAALGTAFYMFRLYLLVFRSGECRADAETQSHIHESPRTMTFALVVLAGLAVVAGVLGLPHLPALGKVGGLLGQWLQPALYPQTAAGGAIDTTAFGEIGALAHHSAGYILLLMGIATVVALVGIGVAWKLYAKGPPAVLERAVNAGGLFQRLHALSKNKFYVDEIYEIVFLKPFRWIARVTWSFIDQFVIDLLFVQGSALIVDKVGDVVRWVQNGQVQRYLSAMVVGGAVLVYCTTRPPEVGIDTRESDGDQVEFRPDVGQGPGAAGARVQWYPVGVSEPVEAPVFKAQLDRAQPYSIRMRWKDPVFDRIVEAHKTMPARDSTDDDKLPEPDKSGSRGTK